MMKKKYLLFLFFCWNGAILFAQNMGDPFFLEADSLYEIDEYKEAIIYFEKARDIFEMEKDWDKLINTNRLILKSHIQLDDYKKAGSVKIETAKISSFKKKESNSYLAECYYLLAYAQGKNKHYWLAFNHYGKAIKIFEDIDEEGYYLVYSLRNAAQIALRHLDYSKAIEYFKKGLALNYSDKMNASLCGQLANSFYFLEEYEEQFKYISKGFLYEPKPSTLAILNINLSGYYSHKEEYGKAEKHTFDALNYYKKERNSSEDVMAMYMTLANIYDAQGFKNKVVSSYSNAEKVATIIGRKSRDKANLYVSIGRYYLKENDLNASLFYFQKALQQVFPGFHNDDIYKNPKASEVYLESWIMDAAHGKARALKNKYEIDGNIKNLEVAADCYNLVISEINELNKNYDIESSKIYLSDYGYTYFEEAIEVNYLLFLESKDKRYHEKIFYLMERSKAVVLADAVKKNKIIIEAAIPEHLLNFERELRVSIANKDLELIKFRNEEVAEKIIDSLEIELYDLKSTYRKQLSEIKRKFPKFQSLIESPHSPSIQDVQQLVTNDSMLVLEFFMGENKIYILKIGRDKVDIHEVENSENVNRLVDDLISYLNNPSQFLNNPNAYFNVAYELYSILLADVLNKDLTASKLLIIPDGKLKNIPFEALVHQTEINSNNNDQHYLLKKYLIYYSNSVNLFLMVKPKNIKGDYFLNVVPGFLSKERGRTPLSYSEKETASISGMKNLKGKEAKLSNFKKLAENSEIIHLSTHASIGGAEGIPKIEFIDTSFFLPEIYALNLKADLVVLSACESQLGELKKGEGVMSLGRGFFYSGASSLVASLWSVNEKSTADIFSHFYKQLQNGIPKAEALRLAKLKYLEEVKSDLKLGPYYWAGFIYLGKNEVIEIPTQNKKLNWGLLILIGSLFFGLIYFFKKIKA